MTRSVERGRKRKKRMIAGTDLIDSYRSRIGCCSDSAGLSIDRHGRILSQWGWSWTRFEIEWQKERRNLCCIQMVAIVRRCQRGVENTRTLFERVCPSSAMFFHRCSSLSLSIDSDFNPVMSISIYSMPLKGDIVQKPIVPYWMRKNRAKFDLWACRTLGWRI